jgi:Putative auto-transporter adhesin, head GIN domain
MAISSPPRPSEQGAPHHPRAFVIVLVLALVAVLALATVVVALLARGTGQGVQGSGVAVTQSRVLARFSSLDLAGSNNITVAVGGRQSVVVHGDSNLLRYVTTRVVAGTLIVGSTGSFTTRAPMSVEVSVPSLTAVKLSGSGRIAVSGIDAPRLTVTLSGSGVVSASGTAAMLDVTLGGSGLARLSDLAARQVHAVVTGSGLIRVTATASLNAAVPGSGSVIYRGNPPQVTSSVTGSGAVTPG